MRGFKSARHQRSRYRGARNRGVASSLLPLPPSRKPCILFEPEHTVRWAVYLHKHNTKHLQPLLPFR